MPTKVFCLWWVEFLLDFSLPTIVQKAKKNLMNIEEKGTATRRTVFVKEKTNRYKRNAYKQIFLQSIIEPSLAMKLITLPKNRFQ